MISKRVPNNSDVGPKIKIILNHSGDWWEKIHYPIGLTQLRNHSKKNGLMIDGFDVERNFQ